MNKIICIIGKTGSGKTYLFTKLMNDIDFLSTCNLHRMKTYTTRPFRNEKDNLEYISISSDEFEQLKKENKFISCITYNTEYGEWSYGHTYDMFDNDKAYIGVVSPEEALQLYEQYGNRVVIIYVTIDTETRFIRLFERNDGLCIEEKIRRIKKEKIEFQQALKKLPIDMYVHSSINSQEFQDTLLATINSIKQKGR